MHNCTCRTTHYLVKKELQSFKYNYNIMFCTKCFFFYFLCTHCKAVTGSQNQVIIFGAISAFFKIISRHDIKRLIEVQQNKTTRQK